MSGITFIRHMSCSIPDAGGTNCFTVVHTWMVDGTRYSSLNLVLRWLLFDLWSYNYFGGVSGAHLLSVLCCDLVFYLSSSCFLYAPLLLVSLDCQLSIASLVFSHVYLCSSCFLYAPLLLVSLDCQMSIASLVFSHVYFTIAVYFNDYRGIKPLRPNSTFGT